MRARSNLRTAAALLFFTLSLTLLPASPARAWNISVRTAICDPESGYAEFRSAGTETSDDLSGLIPEYPLDEIWGATQMEHSWRCDLSDNATITIRYHTYHRTSAYDFRIRATIWVNGAKVTTRKMESYPADGFTDMKALLDEKVIENNLDHIALDDNGLSICLSEKPCEIIPWADLPTEKDPEYRPGLLFGGPPPKIAIVPMHILSGQGTPICEALFEELEDAPLSSLLDYAAALPKSIQDGSLQPGFYTFDIDNDGKPELIRAHETPYPHESAFYTIVNDGSFTDQTLQRIHGHKDSQDPLRPSNECDISFSESDGLSPQVAEMLNSNGYHYYYTPKYRESGVREAYQFSFAFSVSPPVSFPIVFNDTIYLFGRALRLRASQNIRGESSVTHAVYEFHDDREPNAVCQFAAPYEYLEE